MGAGNDLGPYITRAIRSYEFMRVLGLGVWVVGFRHPASAWFKTKGRTQMISSMSI